LPTKKAIPIRRERTAKDFRDEAFNRLSIRYACPDGVEEAEDPNLAEDCKGEPVVTPMLMAADGGLKVVLQALRAHANEDAQSFVELYDSLSAKDRKYLKLEEIAVACGIGSVRLIEVAASGMIMFGQTTTKMMIASSMHKVTKSIVKAATDEVPITAIDVQGDYRVVGHTNGDTKAMELFGKMSGLVPVPKGAQIIVNTQVNNGDSDEPTERPAYLDAGERLRAIHEAVETRRLPAPVSDPIDLGGRLDHIQREAVEILVGSDV
jgi:hypothetical protein